MTLKRKQYGRITLLDVEAAAPEFWDTSEATHLRVLLPAADENRIAMTERGFVWVDRLLTVSISLKKQTVDFQKSIRLPIVLTDKRREEVRQIARKSFPFDRRFHIEPHLNDETARQVIDGWVDELENWFLCLYHDLPIGFLALTQTGPRTSFVHLAAVLQEYRLSGAALSLYANAVSFVLERDYQFLEGRISTQNVPVMNLYVSLGAVFSRPTDVYLKQI